MKTLFFIFLTLLGLLNLTFAKDHSADYKMGTFISATTVTDGTITSTLHGDGTTVAGDVYANHVGVYEIKVADGTWYVTTLSQTQDSMIRGMGMTPMHFKSEKANPLDGLKDGDRVLFRLHERHYLNGKFTLMAIPYADKPNKEVEFSTRFVPDVTPDVPLKPTDNVKAMCDSGRLSPELKAQYCTVPPTPAPAQQLAVQQPSDTRSASDAQEQAMPGTTMKSSTSTQQPLVHQQPTAAFQEVSVDFRSTPTGADITVDGSMVGSTPSSISLSLGDHIITISKRDFRTYERTLTVKAGHPVVAAYLQQVKTTIQFDRPQ